MGQEAKQDKRLKDFRGYPAAEKLCRLGGAKPEWKFMNCPLRKQEADDEVRNAFEAHSLGAMELIDLSAGVLRAALAGVQRI